MQILNDTQPCHPAKYTLDKPTNQLNFKFVFYSCEDIDTLFSQFNIAAERELLGNSEEINRLNIEKEKLHSNLLRSISHDLRTPLTGISGGANFLAESLESLDTETIKSLLNDISCDASWLSSLVDNLLNMTRIQNGRLIIKNEVIDDIIKIRSFKYLIVL